MALTVKLDESTPEGRRFRLSDGRSLLLVGRGKAPEGDDLYLFEMGEENLDITAGEFDAKYAPNVVSVVDDDDWDTPDADEDEKPEAAPSAKPDGALPGTQEELVEAVVHNRVVLVPAALIDAAQSAKADLDQATEEFKAAAEERRQCKEALEKAQEVYNQATQRVLNYKPKDGFPANSPMAKMLQN